MTADANRQTCGDSRKRALGNTYSNRIQSILDDMFTRRLCNAICSVNRVQMSSEHAHIIHLSTLSDDTSFSQCGFSTTTA
eukprot:6199877-Pleurochrysis_carterae.AAC.1